MALRKIVEDGDPILRKISRPVEKFDERLWTLLDDMKETLADAEGLGLAGPQVGVLRRVVIVLDANDEPIELVNPEIISREGEHEMPEGCLSFPGKWGVVLRPEKATIRAQDRHGKTFDLSREGITAQCFCHEVDHLDGVCFVDKVLRFISPEEVQRMRAGETR